VPEGSPVRVRTTSVISTKTAEPGQAFAATLVTPLIADGKELASKGAHVTGQIAEADPGGRVKGVAHLAIRLTRLRLENGDEVTLSTNAFIKLAPASKKKDAVKERPLEPLPAEAREPQSAQASEPALEPGLSLPPAVNLRSSPAKA
jgi:hypothetical protein